MGGFMKDESGIGGGDTGAVLLLVTTSGEDEAKRIARVLVDEHLVACGQIVPGLTSIYRWQGSVHEESEVLLLMKTRASLYGAVEARIKSLHSYDVPQIVALSLASGSLDYLAWICEQTGSRDG